MPRPSSAWEKPPLARPSEPPPRLGDPWGGQPKATFPVEIRPAKPFLERSPSGTRGLLVAAIVLSLTLHSLVVGTIVVANVIDRLWPREKPAAAEPTMEVFDLADFPALAAQVKELARIPSTATAQEDVVPPVNPDKGQLVQLAKPETAETAPEDAKYRSEYDRRVKEETAAREKALTPGVVADEFKGLGKEASSSTDAFAGDKKNSELAVIGPRKGEAGQNGDLAPEDGKTVSEMLDSDPFGILAKRPVVPLPRDSGNPGKPGGEISEAGEGSELAMAGAPNNDYLPSVRPGDRTALNAKKDFFASFWFRVQNQVEPFWAKNVRQANPGHLQKRDYLTRVNVVLDADGKLIAVDVQQGCGIPAWDRAVIAAFESAAPFLNPPRGLIGADGRIHMDDLGFIVSVGNGNIVHSYGNPRAGKLFPGMKEGGAGLR